MSHVAYYIISLLDLDFSVEYILTLIAIYFDLSW